MTEQLKLRRVGVLSPFEEAREQIDEWEKQYPLASHIAMVIDAPADIETTVTGGAVKLSVAAGLFFTAAQLVCE
jgi:hypothetical protein